MTKFIEVTEKQTGRKILFNTAWIIKVSQSEIRYSFGDGVFDIYVTESYDQIKAMLGMQGI